MLAQLGEVMRVDIIVSFSKKRKAGCVPLSETLSALLVLRRYFIGRQYSVDIFWRAAIHNDFVSNASSEVRRHTWDDVSLSLA
jgi:hypothetical protein